MIIVVLFSQIVLNDMSYIYHLSELKPVLHNFLSDTCQMLCSGITFLANIYLLIFVHCECLSYESSACNGLQLINVNGIND